MGSAESARKVPSKKGENSGSRNRRENHRAKKTRVRERTVLNPERRKIPPSFVNIGFAILKKYATMHMRNTNVAQLYTF